MDGTLQQGEGPAFLSCLLQGSSDGNTCTSQSSLLTSVSQGKGADVMIKSDFVVAKSAFYLGCLWFINGYD